LLSCRLCSRLAASSLTLLDKALLLSLLLGLPLLVNLLLPHRVLLPFAVAVPCARRLRLLDLPVRLGLPVVSFRFRCGAAACGAQRLCCFLSASALPLLILSFGLASMFPPGSIVAFH
jgi:hypothetical protein